MKKIWFQHLQDECHKKIPHIPAIPRRILLQSIRGSGDCFNGPNCESIHMGGSTPCKAIYNSICYLCHLYKTNESYIKGAVVTQDFMVITGWVGEYQLKYTLPLLDHTRGLYGPFPVFNRNHYHWTGDGWVESDIVAVMGGKSDRVLPNHPAGEGDVFFPIQPRIFKSTTIHFPSIEECLRISYQNKLHRELARAIFQESIQSSYDIMLPWFQSCSLAVLLNLCRSSTVDINTYLKGKTRIEENPNPPLWVPIYQVSHPWLYVVWARVNLASELEGESDKVQRFLKAHIPLLRYLDCTPPSQWDPYHLCSLYQSLGPSHYDEDRNLFRYDVKKYVVREQKRWWTLEEEQSYDLPSLKRDGYDPRNLFTEENAHEFTINLSVLRIMQKCKETYQETKDESLWFYHGCFIDFVYNCYGMTDKSLTESLAMQAHYPHENRCFTAYDLPDVFHLLITIPISGRQYIPSFTLGKFLQKSMPNCCVSRTLVEDICKVIQTDLAFWKIFSALMYCLLMDMYEGDDHSWDLTHLCKTKQLCSNRDLMIQMLQGDPNKGSNLIYTAFRKWILFMARNQRFYPIEEFKVTMLKTTPRNLRYRKTDVLRTLVEVTKKRLLEEIERGVGQKFAVDDKEATLNRLLFTHPTSWLDEAPARETVLRMVQIYEENGKPQTYDALVNSIEPFQEVAWYLHVVQLLHRVEFESVTLEQLDQVDEVKKRSLYVGEHVSPYAFDVFISLCCNKIKTLQSKCEYGHEDVSFDLTRNCFVCAKHPKKITLTTDVEMIPPKKKNRDERNQFYEIPCKGNPVIRIPLRGFVLIYEGKGRFMHCPNCGSFHKVDWSGWYGGKYQCQECLKVEYHHTCAICSLPATKKCTLTILDIFSPHGIEDAFQRLYFCKYHFSMTKHQNWGIPKERLFEIVRGERRKK